MAAKGLYRLAVGVGALVVTSCAGSAQEWIWWDDTVPPVTSTEAECEVLRYVLGVESYRLMQTGAPNPPDHIYIDPFGGPRPHTVEPDAGPVDVREMIPDFAGLDHTTAMELAPMFTPSPKYLVDCDWGDLPASEAQLSMFDHLDDQEALQYPRMSLMRPVFSENGQWALAGFDLTAGLGYGRTDVCLLQRDGMGWRTVECIY